MITFYEKYGLTKYEYHSIHGWIKTRYGVATKCEGKNCKGISRTYERDAIFHERQMDKNNNINTTQMLVFDLLKRASFNGFDGEHCVKFLINNKDKWNGVMFKNNDYYALRDIDDDSLHIDTVEVLCRDEETARSFMKVLKKNLSPDDISIDKLDYNSKDKRRITMWWD